MTGPNVPPETPQRALRRRVAMVVVGTAIALLFGIGYVVALLRNTHWK